MIPSIQSCRKKEQEINHWIGCSKALALQFHGVANIHDFVPKEPFNVWVKLLDKLPNLGQFNLDFMWRPKKNDSMITSSTDDTIFSWILNEIKRLSMFITKDGHHFKQYDSLWKSNEMEFHISPRFQCVQQSLSIVCSSFIFSNSRFSHHTSNLKKPSKCHL